MTAYNSDSLDTFYNTFRNTTWTGPSLPWQQTVTNTGTTSGNILSTQEPSMGAPEATSVSVMADGYLLITTPFGPVVRVPPSLFKDLVTLATLGLVEKLAPQEADDAR